MSETFTLDPVARIPDAPDDESMILDWARDLTNSLQKDHVENVDRTETMVMSANGLNTRPDAMGARRFFFDEKTGTLYIDSENSSGVDEWQNINNPPTYVVDGIGVHVKYSTSLPYSGGTSGLFSFDEEVYDKANYWAIGDPTKINPPDTKRYSILLVAVITNLADTEEIWVATDINGVTSELNPDESARAASTGAGEEYELKISMTKDMTDQDTLKFGWNSTASFDLTECYAIVSPMTESGGGGSVPDSSGISDHGLLSGLLDVGPDDHTQYLLVSNTGSDRATFATNWTDLTDAGETALHTHAQAFTDDICIPYEKTFSGKNSIGNCVSLIGMQAINVVEIGTTGYDMDVWAVNFLCTSTGSIEFTAAGTTTVASTGSSTQIAAATDVRLIPGSATYDVKIEKHGSYLQGLLASTAAVDMIGISTSPADRVNISNGSVDIWLNTDTVFMGPVSGADFSIDWYTSASTTATFMQWINTGLFRIGDNSFDTHVWGKEVFINAATFDINLTAGVTVASAILSALGRVRLPNLGAPPSSLVNGDMWMESDGLHIYYNGAEKTVAGL